MRIFNRESSELWHNMGDWIFQTGLRSADKSLGSTKAQHRRRLLLTRTRRSIVQEVHSINEEPGFGAYHARNGAVHNCGLIVLCRRL